jgi:hypothetical protein
VVGLIGNESIPTQRVTVVPDWSGRDLKLGTVRAAVRQLGIEWKDFQDA